MAYTDDLANSPTDRVRAKVGDTWPEEEFLSDATYEYLLDKYNGNENRAAREAAEMILFILPRFVRERAGEIEVYGGEWFKNYRQALQDLIKSPTAFLVDAIPYFGGISRTDMKANRDNPDNNRVENFSNLNGCCDKRFK